MKTAYATQKTPSNFNFSAIPRLSMYLSSNNDCFLLGLLTRCKCFIGVVYY